MISSSKTALQFGAGNIGRGFIGVLLSQSGYSVTFVDVVEPLLELINQQKQYTVTEIEPQGKRQIIVKNIKAINGQAEADVAKAISQASLITTAVGPNVLSIIAPAIAKGLQQRADLGLNTPLNIIACENLIDNSRILHDHVVGHLPPDYRNYVARWVGFPSCVVDKVVPPVAEAERAADPLLVVTEGHGLLIVDRAGFVGAPPAIAAMKLTDNLSAYVEQKIFTLNTAHAVIAYLGYRRGYKFIHEALADPEIHQTVLGAIAECNGMLTKRHSIDPAEQEAYSTSTLQRFTNAALPDPVDRVGREPKRKLAPTDRLIQPALLALDAGITPNHLATGIAAALTYDNPDDPQAVELQQALRQHGIDSVLLELCGLKPTEKLSMLVKEEYRP